MMSYRKDTCDANGYIAARVKELRSLYGLSQTEFAALVGWKQTAISDMESGTRQTTVCELLHFSETFGIPAGWFLPELEVTEASSEVIRLLDEYRHIQSEEQKLRDRLDEALGRRRNGRVVDESEAE